MQKYEKCLEPCANFLHTRIGNPSYFCLKLVLTKILYQMIFLGITTSQDIERIFKEQKLQGIFHFTSIDKIPIRVGYTLAENRFVVMLLAIQLENTATYEMFELFKMGSIQTDSSDEMKTLAQNVADEVLDYNKRILHYYNPKYKSPVVKTKYVGTYENDYIKLVFKADGTVIISLGKTKGESYQGNWKNQLRGVPVEEILKMTFWDCFNLHLAHKTISSFKPLYFYKNRIWESLDAIRMNDYDMASDYLLKE